MHHGVEELIVNSNPFRQNVTGHPLMHRPTHSLMHRLTVKSKYCKIGNFVTLISIFETVDFSRIYSDIIYKKCKVKSKNVFHFMKSIQPGITAEITVKLLSYCTSQYLHYHICRFTCQLNILYYL